MRGVVLTLLLLAPTCVGRAGAEDAAPARRPALLLQGVFRLAPSFDETRTLTLFAEKGSIESTYRSGLAPGGEVGLALPVGRGHLGVMAMAGVSARSGRAAYAARLPHPLYLDAHRRSEGTVDGLASTVIAGHVGLAWSSRASGLDVTLFAGPSVHYARAELVESADTTEAYPYDEVTFTLPTIRTSRVAPGAHAGAGLAYPMSPTLALGLHARYGYARVRLQPNEDDRTDFAGGGPQLSVGLRWVF